MVDIADELHLYWPVGARVVGYDGDQDIVGTIAEHAERGLVLDAADGPLVLMWGVVLGLTITGRAGYGDGPGHPTTEVRLRVEGGDVVPLRQPPTAPPGPRVTPGRPYDPDRIIHGPWLGHGKDGCK